MGRETTTIRSSSRNSNNSEKDYLIDESRIAYGGYSLGGLAAVYSLYSSHLPATCVFLSVVPSGIQTYRLLHGNMT